MKSSVYKSYDELPLFLNSDTVAKTLGIAPSSAYELMHEKNFPTLRVGSRMVVPKEKFIQWVEEHTKGGARMRKTKPPVGWEHVKNCFPVPNELLNFDLPGGSIAVYIFLLRHADRRTGQCHPSTATIAKNLHYCRNTVASYVRLLEERGLIVTEHTKIITKNGIKKNGSLLYTIIPLQEVMEHHYEQQFNALERTTERRKAQAKLAEQLGA